MITPVVTYFLHFVITLGFDVLFILAPISFFIHKIQNVVPQLWHFSHDPVKPITIPSVGFPFSGQVKNIKN